MSRLIVADAGPLIALARLGLLDVLPSLFARVMLTSTVLAECEAKPAHGEGPAIRAALERGVFELSEAPSPEPSWGVDAGEAGAIALAQRLDAALLMDDKAGRALAARLGRPMLGTAGVLVLAKRRGLVAEVRSLLLRLRETGYFLGEGVIADVLRLAGE